MSKTTSKAGTTLRKLGTAAKWGGAALAVGFVVEAKKAVTTTQDLTKSTLSLHKNLGLSTKSASEWAGVAKARGVDTTKLGMAFKTLATQISGAGHGSATSIKMFKELGFSQKDIQKSMTDSQFAIGKVADGLNKLPPGADKATISSKLFGRGWQTIAPILRDGSVAMQEQLDTVEKYGGVLEGKTLRQQKRLLANTRENKIAWQGLQIQLAKFVTPALNTVSKQFQRIAAIQADPKLSGEEKFRKSARIIQHDFSKALDFILKMIPQIANGVGQEAPKVAVAFVQGFLKADIWGKLAIGGFLISRMGGTAAVIAAGRTIGAKLGIGIAEGEAAGGAGGAAAGAGLGASILKGLRGAGIVVGGAAIVDMIVQGVKIQSQKKSGDFRDALKGLTEGPASRLPIVGGELQKFREQLDKLPFGGFLSGLGDSGHAALKLRDAIAAVDKAQRITGPRKEYLESLGREAGLTDKAQEKLRKYLDTIRTMPIGGGPQDWINHLHDLKLAADGATKGVRKDLLAMAEDAAASGQITRPQLKKIGQAIMQAGGMSQTARKIWNASLDNMNHSTKSNMQDVRHNILSATDDAEKGGSRNLDQLASHSKSSAENMRKGVTGSVQSMVRAVGKGYRSLGSMTNKQLHALGLKEIAFSASASQHHHPDANLQHGGSIVPGAGVGDKVPAMLEPEEFVVNKKASKKHRALLNAINFEDAPRYAAGGAVNFDGHPSNVAGSLRKLIGVMESQFPGLGVTATTDGVHVSGSDHYTGHAVDLSSGDYGYMDRAAQWVKKSGLYRKLKQGIHNPNLSVNAGQLVPSSYFSDVWAEHRNHIHLAVYDALKGKFGATAQKIAREVLNGPDGPLKSMGQAALDKVRAADNAYLMKHQPMGDIGGTGKAIVSGQYNAKSLAKLFAATGGNGDPRLMGAIGMAESGGNPHALNPSSNASGLWQMLPSTWSAFGHGNVFNPKANATAAHAVLASQGLGAWEAYTSGAYRQYLKRGGLLQKLARGDVVRGKVSWFSGGSTAGGYNASSDPGLAMNLSPGSDSGWNNKTTQHWMDLARKHNPAMFKVKIKGHEARLPVIDLGPSGFTNRAIDVTAPGVRKLGFSTSNFPTDARGVAKLIGTDGKDGKDKKKPPGLGSFSPGRLVDILKDKDTGPDRRHQVVQEFLKRIHQAEQGVPLKPFGPLFKETEHLNRLELRDKLHSNKHSQERLATFMRQDGPSLIHHLSRRRDEYDKLRLRKKLAEHTPGGKDDKRAQRRLDEFLGRDKAVKFRFPHRIAKLNDQIAKLDERVDLASRRATFPGSPGGEDITADENKGIVSLNKDLLAKLVSEQGLVKKTLAHVKRVLRRHRGDRGMGRIRSQESNLEDKLVELQGVTGKGGRIFDVRETIAGLKPSVVSPLEGLDITALQEFAKLVRIGAFAHAPFGGSFAQGGMIPGPQGAPRAIIAHGGEQVIPRGSQPVYLSADIYIGNERVGSIVDARIDARDRKRRQQLRAEVVR